MTYYYSIVDFAITCIRMRAACKLDNKADGVKIDFQLSIKFRKSYYFIHKWTLNATRLVFNYYNRNSYLLCKAAKLLFDTSVCIKTCASESSKIKNRSLSVARFFRQNTQNNLIAEPQLSTQLLRELVNERKTVEL